MNKVSTNFGVSNNNSTSLNVTNLSSKGGVSINFDAPDITPAGGLAIFNGYSKTDKLFDDILSCLKDMRNQKLITHSYDTMLRQRVYQIIAGYQDCNDCAIFRNDRLLMNICRSNGDMETPLASQPTMSRFEEHVTISELVQIGYAFVDIFLDSYEAPPAHLIIDADDTNVNTYGEQEYSCYNSYYKEHCLMPLLIYDGSTGKLILPLLRPGRRNKSLNVSGLLIKMVQRIRKRWPEVPITLRGDSHFCCPRFMSWARTQKNVNYITGLSGNVVLNKKVEHFVQVAVQDYLVKKHDIKIYHTFQYKATSWDHYERVVVKIEVNKKGENGRKKDEVDVNVRFIVTSYQSARSTLLYEDFYCNRGNCELYIGDFKGGIQMERMSCHKFMANQFRLFIYGLAYVIMDTLRADLLQGTILQGAELATIRKFLIDTPAIVRGIRKRLVVSFSSTTPNRKEIEAILLKHPSRIAC